MKSRFDPSRDTVGSMAIQALQSADGYPIITGDMSNEMMKGYVLDLNETIESDPYKGRPFYITVHQSKDLVQPNMIKRRMITTLYRPWPEDDTDVYYVNPRHQEVRFCWALPHWSEMDNMLANPDQFSSEMLNHIRAWKKNDLRPFGFVPVEGKKEHWIPAEKWKDRDIGSSLKASSSSSSPGIQLS